MVTIARRMNKVPLPETLQKVTEKEDELNDVYKRMDEDEKLYFLDPYILKDYKNQKVKNCDNVTLNHPLVYALAVQAMIGAAKIQTRVEGQGLSENQKGNIEAFLKACFEQADEILYRMKSATTGRMTREHVCIRGRVASRNLFLETDGVLYPQIVPVDPRFFSYEEGVNGLRWGAMRMKRTRANIEDEYGTVISGKQGEVVDYWDGEINQVFVDNSLVFEQENPFDDCVYSLAKSELGSTLESDMAKSHEGEGLFWMNRKLYPELNKTTTVLQTLSMENFRPPLKITSPEGDLELEQAEFGSRTQTSLRSDEGVDRMYPQEDIKNSTRLLFAVLDASIQRGSLPNVDFGNLQFPLSAVAIENLGQSKDRIVVLLVNALAIWRQQVSRMLIKQFSKGGIKAKIGIEGYKKEFDGTQLAKEFSINYKYIPISPEQDIAHYSIAQAAGDIISDHRKRRDILQIEDVEAEEEQIALERATREFEELRIYDTVRKLLQMRPKRTTEARMIANRLSVTLDEIMSGNLVRTPKAEQLGGRSSMGQTLPLLSTQGAGVRGPQRGPTKTAPQLTQGQGEENA